MLNGAIANRRVAPQATAVGKALICRLERQEVQEIVALHPLSPVSPKTIVTLPHLLEELAAIRRRGYAIDDEEHAVGVRCVAAPVFAASGEVRAYCVDSLRAIDHSAGREIEVVTLRSAQFNAIRQTYF